MRTSFDLSPALRRLLRLGMQKEGYGRHKSKWICEAIEQLAAADPGFQQVGVGRALERYGAKELVVLTAPAREQISKAKEVIRGEDPEAEGITSQVIRAAIRLRLERLGYKVAEAEGLASRSEGLPAVG